MFGEFSAAHGLRPKLLFGQSVLGSAYTLSGSTGVYSDTGLSVTLPSAGTYIVFYNVRVYIQIGDGDMWITVKLFQTDQGIDVPSSVRQVTLWDLTHGTPNANNLIGFNCQQASAFSAQVNANSACIVRLYAKRTYTATTIFASTISSDSDGYTTLSYLRVG